MQHVTAEQCPFPTLSGHFLGPLSARQCRTGDLISMHTLCTIFTHRMQTVRKFYA